MVFYQTSIWEHKKINWKEQNTLFCLAFLLNETSYSVFKNSKNRIRLFEIRIFEKTDIDGRRAGLAIALFDCVLGGAGGQRNRCRNSTPLASRRWPAYTYTCFRRKFDNFKWKKTCKKGNDSMLVVTRAILQKCFPFCIWRIPRRFPSCFHAKRFFVIVAFFAPSPTSVWETTTKAEMEAGPRPGVIWLKNLNLSQSLINT